MTPPPILPAWSAEHPHAVVVLVGCTALELTPAVAREVARDLVTTAGMAEATAERDRDRKGAP